MQVVKPKTRQKRKRTVVSQSLVSNVLVEEEPQNEYERQVQIELAWSWLGTACCRNLLAN